MPGVSVQSIIGLAIAAAVLLAYAYVAYRKQAWKQVGSAHVAYCFFTLGSLAFWFSMFPPTRSEDEPGISGIGLGIAAALFAPAIGAVVYRIRSHRSMRWLDAILGVGLFVMMGFAFASQRTDVAPEPPTAPPEFWLAAAPWALIALIIFAWLVRTQLQAGNRMGRLITAGQFDEAIRLGDAIAPPKRSHLVMVNLMVALSAAGHHDRAIAAANGILDKNRDDVTLMLMARVHHAAGRSADAMALLERVHPQGNWPQQTREYFTTLADEIRATEVRASDASIQPSSSALHSL